MKFCSLFSGSSGNSLFIKNNNTRILCDAGKNGKQVELALNRIGETAKDLNAIILTHEHSDHVSAAGVLSRRYNIPIYANYDTWKKLHEQNIGKIKPENEIVFENRKPFYFPDLEVTSFLTSHDAACSVGFQISDGKNKMGIATDTGIVTEDMNEYLFGSKLVVLESNHDTSMLETGPYPYYLKERIKGAWGHLSNARAALYASELVKNGTERIVLAHLSEQNNMPFLAEQETANVFERDLIRTGKDVLLEVALRNENSQIHEI